MNRSLLAISMMAALDQSFRTDVRSNTDFIIESGIDYSPNILRIGDGNSEDAGGTGTTVVKAEVISDVMGDGIKIGGEQQTQQQAAASDTRQVDDQEEVKKDDLGANIDAALTGTNTTGAGDAQQAQA